MNLTTLSELQNKFNSALNNATSKKFLIDNELKEIENFLNYDPLEKYNNRGLKKFVSKPTSHRVFKIEIQNYQRTLFTSAFNNLMINGEFETPKNEITSDEQFKKDQFVVKQAYEFSKYYTWLNSLKETPEKSIKKSSLTHKQKLLALYYFGLDTSKYDNSKTAKILSQILDLNEENTRQYLSYLTAGKNNVRTKSNLEKVSQLFEDQELKDISSTIKKDIEKL